MGCPIPSHDLCFHVPIFWWPWKGYFARNIWRSFPGNQGKVDRSVQFQRRFGCGCGLRTHQYDCHVGSSSHEIWLENPHSVWCFPSEVPTHGGFSQLCLTKGDQMVDNPMRSQVHPKYIPNIYIPIISPYLCWLNKPSPGGFSSAWAPGGWGRL